MTDACFPQPTRESFGRARAVFGKSSLEYEFQYHICYILASLTWLLSLSSQVSQLTTLINMLIGDLSKGDRQKIMTICTIDVHARDVVAKLIHQKVENAMAFLWLSQLRHRWDDSIGHCFANICDAQFKYSYEYLGNTPRLVITPLTDR